MRRGPVLAGGALALIAGSYGLWQGLAAARLDEGRVIAQVAALHVAQQGDPAAAGQCFGVPGNRPGVWLTVICGTRPDLTWDVDRHGRIVQRPFSLSAPEL